MKRCHSIFVCVLTLGSLSGPAFGLAADKEGLKHLDKAVEIQLTAETPEAMGEVIEHCREALKLGLDDENAKFAKRLLVSTLTSRASRYQAAMLGVRRVDPEAADQFQQLKQKALGDLDAAIKVDPNQGSTYYLKGRLLTLPGSDREQARKAFDKAVEHAASDEEKAKALTARGTLQDSVDKMEADYAEAIKLTPESAEPVRTRGALYLQMGKLAEAEADLKKAVELEPDHIPSQEIYVLALIRQRKVDEAIAALSKAIEKTGSDELLLQRARLYLAQEKEKEALADFDKLAQDNPDNLNVFLMRAQVYHELKKSGRALTELESLLKKEPHFVPALQLRASILAEQEKYDVAIAGLEKALGGDELESPMLELQLASLYSMAKKYDQALKIYGKLVKLVPDSPQIWAGRGGVYVSLGEHEKAIQDYEKTLKLSPEHVTSLNNLAWLLSTSPREKLRNGKRAVELATRASKLTEHKEAYILSTVAAGYAEAGNFGKAIEWVKMALDVADDEMRGQIEKELQSYQNQKPWREVRPGEPEKE